MIAFYKILQRALLKGVRFFSFKVKVFNDFHCARAKNIDKNVMLNSLTTNQMYRKILVSVKVTWSFSLCSNALLDLDLN